MKDQGVVLLDPVLHKQYKALSNYRPKYINKDGEEILFKEKQVHMKFGKEKVQLETIVASNSLVKPDDKKHLHIVYFNGNSNCFHQDYRWVAEDLLHYAREGKAVTA